MRGIYPTLPCKTYTTVGHRARQVQPDVNFSTHSVAVTVHKKYHLKPFKISLRPRSRATRWPAIARRKSVRAKTRLSLQVTVMSLGRLEGATAYDCCRTGTEYAGYRLAKPERPGSLATSDARSSAASINPLRSGLRT
jgi:hypothetical protein